MKETYVPDETIIPTLARVSRTIEVDGSWEVSQDYSPLPRHHFALWTDHPASLCRGHVRNAVCVFSLADLSTILKAQGILVNKVMTEHDAAIGECLRDSVRQREMLE